MRKLSLLAALAVAACAGPREGGGAGVGGSGLAGVEQLALGDFAAATMFPERDKDTAVALSSAAPSGNTDGYSVAPAGTNQFATGVWCEVDGGANNITGGNVRLWEKPNATEGWTRMPGGDWLSIQSATVTPKWAGEIRKGVWGKGARVYCQLESVTLSGGATVDKYTGIRWERR